MTQPQKHIAIVCNPTAENGKSLELADCIVPILKAKNIAFALITQYWPQAWDAFTEAWIIGGDGTVNYFINQYPAFNLPLAVFAGGTGNDLHFMLYGHMDVNAQVEKVLQALPQKIDAGVCNGHLFLNGIGIGFDGAIVHHLLGKKKRPGKATYLLSVLKHIFTYNEVPMLLEWQGNRLKEETFMVSVANGRRYGGGFTVAPKASVQDGQLDVLVVKRISAATRLRYLPYIERGDHLHLPFIQYHHTTSMVIETPQPVQAHRDGEYFSSTRFEINCLPRHFSFLL